MWITDPPSYRECWTSASGPKVSCRDEDWISYFLGIISVFLISVRPVPSWHLSLDAPRDQPIPPPFMDKLGLGHCKLTRLHRACLRRTTVSAAEQWGWEGCWPWCCFFAFDKTSVRRATPCSVHPSIHYSLLYIIPSSYQLRLMCTTFAISFLPRPSYIYLKIRGFQDNVLLIRIYKDF